MALACELCGKKPSFGNTISHAHNVTRRRWNPNLRRVKAVIKASSKHVRVCTACIRSGKRQKGSLRRRLLRKEFRLNRRILALSAIAVCV